MIELVNICKKYEVRDGKRTVLSEINCTIERGEHVGILGKNGAGKSTLIRLISGTELPTSGQIKRGMSVSWPLAFSGGFQGSLTGLDNLRFICRVYNTSFRKRCPSSKNSRNWANTCANRSSVTRTECAPNWRSPCQWP